MLTMSLMPTTEIHCYISLAMSVRVKFLVGIFINKAFKNSEKGNFYI